MIRFTLFKDYTGHLHVEQIVEGQESWQRNHLESLLWSREQADGCLDWSGHPGGSEKRMDL